MWQGGWQHNSKSVILTSGWNKIYEIERPAADIYVPPPKSDMCPGFWVHITFGGRYFYSIKNQIIE